MVSVIVPIYNVEAYLEQCIRSIQNQSISDFEIILVNDGSTDGSGEICSRYEKEDGRIIYIKTENRGAGPARNTGMKQASGEWLCFVDGDDYLPENALETLLTASGSADIIIGNYAVDKEGKIFPQKFFKTRKTNIVTDETKNTQEGVYLIGNALGCSYYGTPKTSNVGVPWARLYRREFCIANELTFPSIRRMQDTIFNIKAFRKAEKLDFVDETVYCYRINSDSATHKYTPDFELIATQLMECLKTDIMENCETEIRKLYDFKKLVLLIENIRLAYMHPLCRLKRKEKIKGIQLLCEDYGCDKTYERAERRLFSRKQRIVLGLLAGGYYSLAYYLYRISMRR